MNAPNVTQADAGQFDLANKVEAIIPLIAARAEAAETDPAGLGYEFQLIADAGLLAACLPAANGGADVGMTADAAKVTFQILRRLGYASLPVGRLFEGHVNAVKLVQLYGTSMMQARMAEVVQDAGLLGVWGADGAEPLCFRKLGSGAILQGAKIFASGLGLVRLAVVSMRDAASPVTAAQLALVEVSDRSRQNTDLWSATGMRATLSGRFDFADMEIPDAHFLGAAGDYSREPFFEGGIWRYCAVQLGGAEALLDYWRAALQQRGRFDDAFQLGRFTRAAGLCRAMTTMLRNTASTVESAAGRDASEVDEAVLDALLTRQFVEESCVEILALCEKSLGTEAHFHGPVERIRRDLSTYLRQAAPDAKLLKAGRLLASGNGVAKW
jgi:alkylation response protein AidB-like acyl-CoA dehydrogenase